MKLKKITIEGFRGAPKPFELLLDGMSLCLLGENGLGKTTIVDGLEYWSVGKLENFTREGYGLDATINLDHGPPATITCERQGHATLRRTLSSSKAEDLEVVGPTALDSSLPPALPILRHATMARFMANSPGDKKRALIGVLGLEELLDFRDTLVKATNVAKDAAADANTRAAEELSTLGKESAGASVIDRAEALRKDGGLTVRIKSESDLAGLDLAKSPAVEVRVNRAELGEKIARSAEAMKAEAVSSWNEVVRNREATEAVALHDLVSAGQKVLATWGEDVCPLCLTPHDKGELSVSLDDRAVSLAELDQKLRSARTGLDVHRSSTSALANSIGELLATPLKEGWPHTEALTEIVRRLEEHAANTAKALADNNECAAALEPGLDEILPGLRTAAVSDAESPAGAAVAQLERLRVANARTC